MKSGWKTTEFWAVVAGSLVAILNKGWDLQLPSEGIVAMAVAIAGYAISRGIAKKSQ